MTLEEIKLRRLAGQHLTDKSDAAAVLHDLCGIQAQMMSYAEHSLGIRCIDAPEYLDGFSAKSWTLRGTMHIFALDDLPLFLHDGRTHYLRKCDMFGADGNISTERKRYFADAILRSISGGADTRDELKARCFELGMTERRPRAYSTRGAALSARSARRVRYAGGSAAKKHISSVRNLRPGISHTTAQRRFGTRPISSACRRQK